MLTPYEMVICAAPSYLARHGWPQSPADLSGHDCLGLAHWLPRGQWEFDGPDGPETVQVSGPFVANMGHALRAAGIAGLGIVLQPRMLLEHDIDEGRLVQLLPQWRHASRPMHILIAPDRRRTRKLASFVEFITGRFPPR